MPFNIGPGELVIVLIIALLVLGPGKLPEVGSALGKGLREFRNAASDVKEATSTSMNAADAPPPAGTPPAPPPVVAQSADAPAAVTPPATPPAVTPPVVTQSADTPSAAPAEPPAESGSQTGTPAS